jgi:hypothetical protein
MNFFGLIATLLFGVLALHTARAWPVGAPEMVMKLQVLNLKFRQFGMKKHCSTNSQINGV